ncbi:MAG: hypothetical protein E7120_05960 [Bacteroidales bacterium]|nr:hypothetical protein [Bacteroidales bacterium]
MKKNLFMIAAVAIAAVACNKELPQEQIPVGDAKVYSATADGNETKAVLDGKATNWEDGDAILIYDGTSAAKYVTSLETPAPNADFVIADGETALAGEKVIAVYPEWADGYKSSVADVEGKTLSKAYLASNQNAKAGSYDPNTAIAMAYSEDANLEFKNATALLKFTVANENVKTVTVYSIGGEKITGEWALEYNDGAPKATPAEGDASAGWVELSAGEGTFEVGAEYFISVYPQTLASGFGLEFGFEGVSAKQLVKKYESSVDFKRNVILNLGNLEFTGTIEPEEPEEVVVDYWAVVGSMLDNWASEKKMTLDGDWYVVEGIELTTTDQFKFRANGDANWTINRGAEGAADGVVIADNVETTVIQGGKNFAVATDGVYSLYINKYANKVKVVRTGDIVVVEPGTTTPGEASEWALLGAFSGWIDQTFVTTSVSNVVVLENVKMKAAEGFLVRKPTTEWADKYGAGNVNYIQANSYITTAKDGGDMCLEADGTYDIYFNTTTKAIYVMTAGTDYTTAVEQTVSGKEPEVEEPEVTANMLYLKPNSNWKVDNARFAAYFFGNGDKWVSMTDSDSDGIYEVNIPEGYDYGSGNVIFCRMNPNTTANNWNNKWNQTADLAIPKDGTNLYTVKDGTWDNGGGTWSVK